MESNKRLVRTEHEKMVAGVCGGIANYFNIDVTIVRVLFVIATLGGGAGVPLYFILWLVMPQMNQASLPPQATVKSNLEEMKNQAQSIFSSNKNDKAEAWRFDPYTGQPVQNQQQQQQSTQRRFDPYTGEEIKQ